MSIVLAIPSLWRAKALSECVESAWGAGMDDILIQEEKEPRAYPQVCKELVREVFSKPSVEVCVLGTDSSRYHEDFLENLIPYFEHTTDLLVGQHIVNVKNYRPEIHNYNLVVIGRGFYDRFPDGQFYCPAYWHMYCDRELGECASTLGKFQFAEDCRVTWVHGTTGGPKDETWRQTRLHHHTDSLLYEARQDAGKVWGLSYEL